MIINKDLYQFKTIFFKRLTSILPFKPYKSNSTKLEKSNFWEQVLSKVRNEYSNNLTPFELLENENSSENKPKKGVVAISNKFFKIKKSNLFSFERKDSVLGEKQL